MGAGNDLGGHRDALDLAAHGTGEAERAHQSLDRATRYPMTLAVQDPPDIAGSVGGRAGPATFRLPSEAPTKRTGCIHRGRLPTAGLPDEGLECTRDAKIGWIAPHASRASG